MSNLTNELQLATECKKGNNAARKVLYEQYAGRMLTICIRYLNNRDVAEDVLHDCFIKIFHSFDKFTWRGDGSLRAWMERITVNEALQWLRKNDTLNKSVAIDEVHESYSEPNADDIEIIPEDILLQFIDELPVGYRTIFNLYIFEEKSHKEIAQILDINEKSSSSQLFRAKSALAKRVNEWLKKNDA